MIRAIIRSRMVREYIDVGEASVRCRAPNCLADVAPGPDIEPGFKDFVAGACPGLSRG